MSEERTALEQSYRNKVEGAGYGRAGYTNMQQPDPYRGAQGAQPPSQKLYWSSLDDLREKICQLQAGAAELVKILSPFMLVEPGRDAKIKNPEAPAKILNDMDELIRRVDSIQDDISLIHRTLVI